MWASYGLKTNGLKVVCRIPLHNSCADCAKTLAEGPITQSATRFHDEFTIKQALQPAVVASCSVSLLRPAAAIP